MSGAHLLLRLNAAALLACAAPAQAADLSGDLGLVSDYRFRGISLSDGRPAVQGSITLESEAGFYAGVWASMIRAPGGKSSAEVDIYAGYGVGLSDEIGLDFMATYYAYPSDRTSNYVEGSATLKLTHGKFETSLGFSFAPKQAGTEDDSGHRRGNSYFVAQQTITVPDTSLKIIAAAGYERGFFDESPHGGKWDWTAGVEFTLAPATAAVSYIGTDTPGESNCLVGSIFLEF